MSKRTQELRAERAAAALREQQRQERRRRWLSIGGVVLAIVLVVAGGFLVNSLRDTSTKVAQEAPAIGSAYGVTIGSSSAPHKVVIYEDFICPFCGELEKRTRSELADLAARGRVQVEYRPFALLSEYSRRAAAAFGTVLQSSGPEIAKKYHDLLFENQPSEQGPFPSNADLATLAGQAGASASVQAEVAAGKGTDWADRVTHQADSIGVRSTPTILLDGKVFANGRTIEELAANLLAAVR